MLIYSYIHIIINTHFIKINTRTFRTFLTNDTLFIFSHTILGCFAVVLFCFFVCYYPHQWIYSGTHLISSLCEQKMWKYKNNLKLSLLTWRVVFRSSLWAVQASRKEYMKGLKENGSSLSFHLYSPSSVLSSTLSLAPNIRHQGLESKFRDSWDLKVSVVLKFEKRYKHIEVLTMKRFLNSVHHNKINSLIQ